MIISQRSEVENINSLIHFDWDSRLGEHALGEGRTVHTSGTTIDLPTAGRLRRVGPTKVYEGAYTRGKK